MPSKPREYDKVVRYELKKLELLGFIEIWDTPGRPSLFIPHRTSHASVPIPQNLWKNGWLRALDGKPLQLLVALLGESGRNRTVMKRSSPGRASKEVRLLAERGTYLVSGDTIDRIPLEPSEKRRALADLCNQRILAEIRGEPLYVILDPKLQGRPRPS
jgi:hypothetical protein